MMLLRSSTAMAENSSGRHWQTGELLLHTFQPLFWDEMKGKYSMCERQLDWWQLL